MTLNTHSLRAMVLTIGTLLFAASDTYSTAPDISWQHLTTRRGEIPIPPGGSVNQTGSLVGDFDGDGISDFIISFRQKPPALVMYRRSVDNWDPYVIENDLLTVEAGGTAGDVDGDGDLDVVFGGDWQSNEVWWWENPAPHFHPNRPWIRRIIKTGGSPQHHDQVFADFLGTGRPQLVFWNQQAKTLFLAEVPADPKSVDSWPLTEVISADSTGATPYTEGLSAFDVDDDGRLDILAYDSWFKHTGGKTFKRIKFASHGGLIFAGYFKDSKHPQIAVSVGDGIGPVKLYDCSGNPENPADWSGADLVGRDVIHGHSLQLGDIDRDGNLDLFLAEMAKWNHRQPDFNNPGANAWIFYGDGKGNLEKTVLAVGHGWHEARLVDLDGDGDLDLLNKPYTWETPRIDAWLNNGTRKGAQGAGTSASFRGPVGLQLYSLRDINKDNVALGLQYARNFGFREVELAGTYDLSPADFRRRLDAAGLRAVSMHVGYKRIQDQIPEVVAEARAVGVKYVGVGWVPMRPFDEKAARDMAAVFNRAGAELARHGLRIMYHNHGYEFTPLAEGTAFDVFVRETDPKLVALQMDIFWVVHPGHDPIALLRKYPDRWELMHVKDLRKGIKGNLSGQEDVRNDVALGTGQIDVAAIVKAAQEVGVKHFIIEDEAPTATEQIPQSLKFLEGLSW